LNGPETSESWKMLERNLNSKKIGIKWECNEWNVLPQCFSTIWKVNRPTPRTTATT
jgi:hypothetical protein